MTITRVQHTVEAYSPGGSGQIVLTLPSPPTPGNRLFLVLGRSGLFSPPGIASSIGQAGATWTLDRFQPWAPDLMLNLWSSTPLAEGADQSITVNLSLGAYAHTAVLIEYSDVLKFGVIYDALSGQGGSSNIAGTWYTPTTSQPQELWLGALVNQYGSTTQIPPATNGFQEVVQVPSSAVGGSNHHRLGVYEKIVSAVGIAGTEVTLSESRYWVGFVATIYEDLSTTHQLSPGMETLIGEQYDIGAFLDIATAEKHEMPLDMSMVVKVIGEKKKSWLDVFFIPDPSETEKISILDVAIVGVSESTSQLDVYVTGTAFISADLSVFCSFMYERSSNLNIHIGAEGSTGPRIYSRMDIGIVDPVVLSNVVTTPEGSQYINCRSLWEAVPKQHKKHSLLEVSIV